ncbi:hypothetical protein C7E12_13280, partial [Stenotrophomonas maltophilia]
TSALSEEKRLAAQRLAGGVMARVRQLRELGLGYLSLDRATPTLSAGELQRLRLATQLSSLLFGVLYVLDEPSAGLHRPTAKRCTRHWNGCATAVTRCSLLNMIWS